MNALIILYLLYFVSFFIIFAKRNGAKKGLLFLAFLIITPWCLQLLKSGIQASWPYGLIKTINGFLSNFSANSSSDFLFFMGDKNKLFGTRETGPFYIFQSILIVLGLWKIISQKKKDNILILVWFIVAVLLISLLNTAGTFSGGLWYFLPLQLISFIGAEFLFVKYFYSGLKIKLPIILLLMFAFYETVNFMHIFFIHYPKRLILP